MENFEIVKNLDKINSIQKERVEELVNSMLKNGWKGSPILYTELGLVTGSHRVEALQHLEDVYWDVEEDIQIKIDDIFNNLEIIDVSDVINQYCFDNNCSWDQIDFSCLGEIFKGTEIEEYKNDIEW